MIPDLLSDLHLLHCFFLLLSLVFVMNCRKAFKHGKKLVARYLYFSITRALEKQQSVINTLQTCLSDMTIKCNGGKRE